MAHFSLYRKAVRFVKRESSDEFSHKSDARDRAGSVGIQCWQSSKTGLDARGDSPVVPSPVPFDLGSPQSESSVFCARGAGSLDSPLSVVRVRTGLRWTTERWLRVVLPTANVTSIERCVQPR